MIALTQEKREELIKYAKERLASHVIHGGCSDEEDIFKIALASLTAEPVAYADSKAILKMINGQTRFFTSFPEISETKTVGLFIDPPVPEVKLPTEQDLEDLFMTSGEHECQSREEWDLERERRLFSINACKLTIEEIKRLNGLGE